MRILKWTSFAVVFYVLISACAGIFLCDMALHPGRKPLSEASRSAAHAMAIRYHAALEDVSIAQSDGVLCRAWYFQTLASKRGTVIVLHGLSDNRSGMMGYIELFLAHGYNVLAPDGRAHGSSDSEIATYGLLERHDVLHWLEWLRQREPEKPVYGLGESMGAAILLQSLQAGALFRAVVAEASFSNFAEIGCDRVSQKLPIPLTIGRIALRPAVEFGFLRGRQRYGIDLREVAPERQFRLQGRRSLNLTKRQGFIHYCRMRICRGQLLC